MAVMRINKNQNYTVMSNYHFREKNMSLKAKGLLSLMLSLPNDWDYSITGLVSICKENETAIKNTLKELQKFGYLQITKLMPDKDKNRTRIEYVYDIFERPQEGKKQEVENLPLENQPLENHGQLNTKELNTKELNTKEYNIKKIHPFHNEKDERKIINFIPPTVDEVKEYLEINNYPINAEDFVNYYESIGWMRGNKPIVNWKACVAIWVKNQRSNYITNNYRRHSKNEISEEKISYDIDEYELMSGDPSDYMLT